MNLFSCSWNSFTNSSTEFWNLSDSIVAAAVCNICFHSYCRALGRSKNLIRQVGIQGLLKNPGKKPNFAGQVLPNRTKSGLIFISILQYQFSKDKVCGNKFCVKSSKLGCTGKFRNWRKEFEKKKKKNEKKSEKKNSIFNSVWKVRRSGRRTSGFRTDFENFPDLPNQTCCPVEP